MSELNHFQNLLSSISELILEIIVGLHLLILIYIFLGIRFALKKV